jgi:hypothetical protein
VCGVFITPQFTRITDNVEMEIVLPGTMTVMESHDIALALQHKLEGLEEVERAFVHVRVSLVVCVGRGAIARCWRGLCVPASPLGACVILLEFTAHACLRNGVF